MIEQKRGVPGSFRELPPHLLWGLQRDENFTVSGGLDDALMGITFVWKEGTLSLAVRSRTFVGMFRLELAPAGVDRASPWGARPISCGWQGSRRRSGCIPAEPYPPLEQS